MNTLSPQSISPLLPALERLVVYRKALALARIVSSLHVGGPLGDQLLRAAQSVVLNIAEGAGQASLPAKRRHYTIARGSAFEVAAALDLAPSEVGEDARGLLLEVTLMLTALARGR